MTTSSGTASPVREVADLASRVSGEARLTCRSRQYPVVPLPGPRTPIDSDFAGDDGVQVLPPNEVFSKFPYTSAPKPR